MSLKPAIASNVLIPEPTICLFEEIRRAVLAFPDEIEAQGPLYLLGTKLPAKIAAMLES